MPDDALIDVLGEIQRRGGIGRGSLPAAVAHAEQYAFALPPGPCRIVDLGSGGGLPALVIAWRRLDAVVTMIERRDKRADLLRYAVRALSLDARCEVIGGDVATWVAGRGPDAEPVDVVTARSFAPPLVVLDTARTILGRTGLVLVSDPPDGVVRWTPSDLVDRLVRDDGTSGGIHRFRLL